MSVTITLHCFHRRLGPVGILVPALICLHGSIIPSTERLRLHVATCGADWLRLHLNVFDNGPKLHCGNCESWRVFCHWLGVIAPVFGAADKDAILDKEKAVWQIVQDKKFDAFSENFASDYRAAYAEGLFNLDQEKEAIHKVDLKSYSISDSTVVMPDQNTALLTYKATMQATLDGKDMSGRWNCASLWHRSGAEWKLVFHTEVNAQ